MSNNGKQVGLSGVPVTTTKDDITDEFPHVQADQYVLLHMPSGNIKLINIKPNSQINLGKFGTFQSDNLIGKPFGLSYEIYDQKGNIRPCRNLALFAVEDTGANNQMIKDDTAVQKMSYEEVEKLKQEGLKGNIPHEEIIQKIVASHTEFDKKTEFSKAKYIERKRKKFMKVFTPVRPTLYSIANHFFVRNPDKIKFLRMDTLSQLLSLVNAHANSKFLVVDDTQGLIVSALAERMGGHGHILAITENETHNYDVLRYLNLSKDILSVVRTVPMSKVDQSVPFDEWTDKPEEEIAAMDEYGQRHYHRRKLNHAYKNESRRMLYEGGYDGLIISSPYMPETVIKTLLPYVAGSRRIVVYSHSKEPLLEAAHWMRTSKDFLSSDITESSLRQYQVLPGRTHPEMSTSAGGGYLLSALRVIDCPFDPALVQRDDNNRRGKKRKGGNKDTSNKKADKGDKSDDKSGDKSDDNAEEKIEEKTEEKAE